MIFEIWLQKEHATGWIMLADYLNISDFGGKLPTVREGRLVFVGQKTFCRTKTQLALFA